MSQRGIKHFFSGRVQQGRPVAPCTPASDQQSPDALAPVEKDTAQHVKPVVQQFSRKRRRAEEGPSEPAAVQQEPPRPPLQERQAGGQAAATAPAAAAQGGKLPAGRSSGGGSGRQLTQMHLDAGQRDFHLSKCAICGLVYAKGEPSDEKLHAGYHASATKGLRYQPWPGERVVLAEGGGGRVVHVPCGGGAGGARPKKLQELCGFLEDQMGLVKGWLLGGTAGAPASPPLGFYLYVSPAKRVLGCVVAEPIREACPVVPALGPAELAQLRSHGSAAQPRGESRGTQPRSSPGSAAAGLSPTSRPAASITFSSRPAGAAGGEAGPVAAAEMVLGDSPQPGLATCTAIGGAEAAGGDDGRSAESSPEPAVLPSPPPMEALQQTCPASGRAASPAKQEAEQQQQQVGSGGPTAAQPAAAPPALRQQAQQREGEAAPAPAPLGPATLVVDRSRRMRAVCGVRLVWVSLEARRRGIATQLLDCVRSQFVTGYVVPRHELAFTQPSDQGRALIEAYASTRRFLVYLGARI